MSLNKKEDGKIDPKAWEIGTMTDFLKDVSAESLKACRAAGIQCVELFFDGRGANSAEEVIEKHSMDAFYIRKSGLKLWSVHLPFGTKWDVSTKNDQLRENAVKKMCTLVEQASRWEAQIAVIHASWEPVKESERAERMLNAENSLKLIAKKAKECNMRLAVECLPRTCLGNCSTELLKLIKHENTFVCMDTNHLLREAQSDFISKLGDKIITLHVSDYDGVDERHWLPGKGIINWKEVIAELNNVGYKGPFMFEVNRTFKKEVYEAKDLVDSWNKIVENLK